MTPETSFAALDSWLNQRQQKSDYRQLLLLTDADTLEGAIVSTIQKYYSNSLFVGTNWDQTEISKLAFKDINLKLGKAYSAVIMDCRHGFVANALYAGAGLVVKSGILILLTPKISLWPQYFATHHGIKFSYKDHHKHSYFAHLLSEYFTESPCSAWWSPSEHHLPILARAKDANTSIGDIVPTQSTAPITLTKEQGVIIDSIANSWQSDKSINVIHAERGRGKTTVLAHLAGLIWGKNHSHIYICAPSKAQSVHFFDYLAQQKSNTDDFLRPVFISPDQYDSIERDSLVLVDEMASIAPSLLSKLCAQSNHVVLAGTLDGYEGSGQGLVFRWFPQYAQLLNIHQLTKAFRWVENDPLEVLISKVFSPVFSSVILNNSNTLTLRQVSKDELVNEPTLFQQCFGLLMAAHYQSSANDIQRMLDGADHCIWTYTTQSKKVIGIICTIYEGGPKVFDDEVLSEDISKGKRRVQGHMSTQALSQGLLKADVSNLTLCRIHRIAIAPEHQRKGFGKRLLKALHQHQATLQIDGFTTSFGMTQALDRFWHSNGYEVARIGQRQDTSSAAITGHYIHKDLKDYKNIKRLGQMSIYADVYYLNQFHPALSTLICERIKNAIMTQLNAKDVYAFCCSKALAFINNQISFAMVRSNLYFIAQYDDSTTLTELILKQHTPHMSKEEKLACTEAIRFALEQQFS